MNYAITRLLGDYSDLWDCFNFGPHYEAQRRQGDERFSRLAAPQHAAPEDNKLWFGHAEGKQLL